MAELARLSQVATPKGDLPEASDRFRAALLLHGSTAASAWPTVERVGWISPEDGIQGPGLVEGDVPLVDLIRALQDNEEIPQCVQDRLPDLSLRDYRAGLHVIWLLLAQLYYQEGLASVEDGGILDREAAEAMFASYIEKLQAYRRDPAGYLGCDSIEEVEREI